MLSYNRRLPSGHFTCYLNRTYHVLTTAFFVAFFVAFRLWTGTTNAVPGNCPKDGWNVTLGFGGLPGLGKQES
jgi:hypothetical protein